MELFVQFIGEAHSSLRLAFIMPCGMNRIVIRLYFWKVSPALGTEYLLETGMGLASKGLVNRSGFPGMLQAALTAGKFIQEYRLSSIPFPIQVVLFAILAPFGRLTGKKPVYPEFID